MSLLDVSHQRALGDLLSAERQLREQSEHFIQELRKVLLETAIRLDGERLEAIRREKPTAPANWSVAEWRLFLRDIPSVRGWGVPVASTVPTARERELLQQIEGLKVQLDSALHQLGEERERAASIVITSTINSSKNDSELERIKLPEGATSRLIDIVEDVKSIIPSLPQKPPSAFAKILDGGGRLGGDRMRAYQRYWIVAYLIGRWGMSASMEIEEALAQAVDVSSGSGSLRRVLLDLAEANLLIGEKLEMSLPRTALKLYRLSENGQRLYQELFHQQPLENEWSKLIRKHEGERFPEHTLGVLTFAMHARKRGYATQVLPEVNAEKAVPDVWIACGDEQLYVEVELGVKERTAKWRNQAELNKGKTAICAGTIKGRQRLSSDCKLDNLRGVATDLETLILTKYKTVDHATPMWIEQW